MIFPIGATRRTQHQTAAETLYDAVVVGGGISGSIIADELSRAGKRVLVLEAGIGQDHSLEGYEGYLERFYATAVKDNQSPYPLNPNAPMPRSTDAHRILAGQPDSTGYLVQNGPFATDTTYTRVLGGTTMHWEGKTPRMLPEDFDIRSRYGVGRDWPLSYEDLMPFYAQAEREIGVSADVEHQTFLGAHFEPGYVFPMHELPLSYLDQMVAKGIDGTFVELDGEAGRAPGPGLPAGPQRHPQPRVRRRPRVHARGCGEHQPGRGGRPLPGKQQLRADLPGPGQVQRRQDPVEGAGTRQRRPARPDRRLEGDHRPASPAG